MNIASLPIIMILVLGIMQILKNVADKNENFLNTIPLFSGILGAILGIIAFYVIPDLIPATNILYAIFIGLIMGLAAVGLHQTVKQIAKKIVKKEKKDEPKDEDKE